MSTQVQRGFSTYGQTSIVTRSIPKLATIGRAIGQGALFPLPRVVTILTIARPTTSSIMAAPTSTTPALVFCMPADERIAKVVPKDVEQSEAPAENAARGVGYAVPELVEKGKLSKMKDNAMGISKPIVATDIDMYAVFFSDAKSVFSPPSNTSPIKPK